MNIICIALQTALLLTPIRNTSLPVNFVVAIDGSGDFASIQAAVDNAPADATSPFIILIKNGVYKEKISIDKPFITLLGEDRDSTRILFAILRSDWLKDHPGNDWGSAVINIGDNASDLTLANLTVHNNYGDLYGNHDHQFAIRGFGATRIMILNCTIKSAGGDALSLWNRSSGLYYHANCYFEGWVDYVCPRGWCYITSCNFFGFNKPSASIWHDGSHERGQKFVIRNSKFDGVPGFPLGRNHRDAQFYLLDCTFSENMADRPIYQAKPPADYQWGERYYYYNCHRHGGDYDWHTDNIWEAEGSPAPGDITPAWTFNYQWDPEKNIPAVFPVAYRLEPDDGKMKVDWSPWLSWLPVRNATGYRIYFGTSEQPEYTEDVTEAVYRCGMLKPDTKYYWRIDTVTDEGIRPGTVWSFRTRTNRIPPKAVNPFPAHDATGVPINLKKISWDMDITLADTAKIYFGVSPDSIKLTITYTAAGWNPGPLVPGQTYYWRVDLSNQIGQVSGDVWRFTVGDVKKATTE